MRLIVCRLLALTSLLGGWQTAKVESRPRYGGTLRVEMRERVRTLNPAEWPGDPLETAAQERLVSLVFEPLVRLDESGEPRPALAVSWRHDPDSRIWRFRLRPQVKFHDGSDATPRSVAAGLQLEPDGLRISVSGETLSVESDHPRPDLLFELSRPSRSISIRGAGQKLSGTGPFRVAQWEPGRRAVLVANEQYWAGRPFVDAVSFEMGRPLREQTLDLELGKADFVEIPPNEVRRSAQRGSRIWSSSPDVLIALVFGPGRDSRLREAVALSIDRAAIHSVLLQKVGEPAAALLPQGLSGYAYLFSAFSDPKKARQLSSTTAQPAAPLVLACDYSDQLARSIAERISVDAREAGIRVQVSAKEAGSDIRLESIPLRPFLPGPALSTLLAHLHLPGFQPLPAGTTLESVYAGERAVLESFDVIPLFHIPETYASSSRLKSWNTPGVAKSGEWRFDDLWLDVETP